MSTHSRRIAGTDSGAGLPFAAWLSGLALAMLVFGGYGAMRPLLPSPGEILITAGNDEVAIAELQAMQEDSAAASKETGPKTPAPEADLDIPSLPEIPTPLLPPEVPELVAMDKPPPLSKLTTPTPKPKVQPVSAAKPARHASAEKEAGGGSREGPATQVMSGIGSGRFSSPAYPSAARALRQQGLVRVLVTVETSGTPSSVEVQTSSGFPALDNAAQDHIRRRWRWPAGPVRRYIAPIYFQIR